MRTVRGTSPEGGRLARTDLKVYAMRDTATAQAARQALAKLDGVEGVLIDIPTRRITIMHQPAPEMVEQAVQALLTLGLRARRKG